VRYSNKGRPRGQAAAFTKTQLRAIADQLAPHRRNSALFAVAVCSCLRASDLLGLRVRDVTGSNGRVVGRFTANVRKTTSFHAAAVRRMTVTCFLSDEARCLLGAYLAQAGLLPDQRLFPITANRYRQLVKQWSAAVGLDSRAYSGHSTRRSLPSIVYAETRDVAACQCLLGHKDLTHTSAYLGVDVGKAIAVAKAVMDY